MSLSFGLEAEADLEFELLILDMRSVSILYRKGGLALRVAL